jgi:hypothetical protein
VPRNQRAMKLTQECQERSRMDAKPAVWNGIFFRWVFFGRFPEKSSSFFTTLSLLPSGFSSAASRGLALLVPFDFGTDEAAAPPSQVPPLHQTVSSRLSQRTAPALLP